MHTKKPPTFLHVVLNLLFDELLEEEFELEPLNISLYETDTSWIDREIIEMKKTLDSDTVPEINKSCEKCMYLGTGFEIFNKLYFCIIF